MRRYSDAVVSSATPWAKSAQASTGPKRIRWISNSRTSSFAGPSPQHSRITVASSGCASLRTSGNGMFRPCQSPLAVPGNERPQQCTSSRKVERPRIAVRDKGLRLAFDQLLAYGIDPEGEPRGNRAHRRKHDFNAVAFREQQAEQRLYRTCPPQPHAEPASVGQQDIPEPNDDGSEHGRRWPGRREHA